MIDTPNDMPSELKLTAKSLIVGRKYNQTKNNRYNSWLSSRVDNKLLFESPLDLQNFMGRSNAFVWKSLFEPFSLERINPSKISIL